MTDCWGDRPQTHFFGQYHVLAFNSTSTYKSKTIIGGHFCGVVGGLASYHLIVAPHDLTLLIEPFSSEGMMLAIGSVIAVILTVFLMLYFEASHPPACATTLIISLGILSSWQEAGFILIAVALMYLCYRLLLKIEI